MADDCMGCPTCKEYGFFAPQLLCCTESFQCAHCLTKWRMPGQKGTGLGAWIQGMTEKIYNSNTYSDLYKVLFAQMCPSCKVMIVRSEGCKFMECGNCRYQFCWLCLSEFYTEFHYYYSMCPLRIIPIYGAVTLCSILLLIKLCYSFQIVCTISLTIAFLSLSQFLTFGIAVLAMTAFIKFVKYIKSRSKMELQAFLFLLGGLALASAIPVMLSR